MYTLQRGKIPPPAKHTDGEASVLKSVEYPFIAITSKSTQIWSDSTC